MSSHVRDRRPLLKKELTALWNMVLSNTCPSLTPLGIRLSSQSRHQSIQTMARYLHRSCAWNHTALWHRRMATRTCSRKSFPHNHSTPSHHRSVHHHNLQRNLLRIPPHSSPSLTGASSPHINSTIISTSYDRERHEQHSSWTTSNSTPAGNDEPFQVHRKRT